MSFAPHELADWFGAARDRSPIWSSQCVPPALVLLITIIAACDETHVSPVDPERTPPSVTRYVTGAALEHVDASGRFILPPPRAPDDIQIVTPERAHELALAFMRTWGEPYKGTWEHQRGGQPLSLGSLKLADRVYFAVTPHGRFPDGYHGAYRRMFGPQYLLFFEQDGEPVISLGIAAYSGDLEIRDGRIKQPYEGGSYFSTLAVTRSGRSPYAPISPEEAVAQVCEATGAKAVEVPELVLRAGWKPMLALWRVKLDRPVHVRREDGTRGSVREVFVGPRREVFATSNEQPAELRTGADRTPFRPDAPAVPVAVGRREGLPMKFDEVTLAGENRP